MQFKNNIFPYNRYYIAQFLVVDETFLITLLMICILQTMGIEEFCP